MTKGQLLYECLLAVRPTQFAEATAGTEPRTPWEGLSEKTQWSQEEWERIAAQFEREREPRDGATLYHCILCVCPMQRRDLSPDPYRRPRWHNQTRQRCDQWHEIARLFWERVQAT